MRRSTLLTQVLAVNGALVGVTAFVAAVVARDRLPALADADGLLVLALTVSSAILLNSLLLRARLEPMSRLLQTMTKVDLARPGVRATTPRRAAKEVQELAETFNRMLDRLEEERRGGGGARGGAPGEGGPPGPPRPPPPGEHGPPPRPPPPPAPPPRPPPPRPPHAP